MTSSNIKPLDEVLKERREHYVSRALAIADSFKLEKLKFYFEAIANEIYGSRDIGSIADFESNIDSGTLRVSFKFGNLEEVVDEVKQVPVVSGGSVEVRVESHDSSSANSSIDKPVLNYESFISERDNGLTLEQIKSKYDIPVANQLGAFSANYKRLIARRGQEVVTVSPSESVTAQTPSVDDSSKPLLTYDAYVSARDSGKTHDEAKAMFRPAKPRQIGPYSGMYARKKLGQTSVVSPTHLPSQNVSRNKPITPGLDYSIYRSRREMGNTDEQIRTEFSVESNNRRFIAFGGNYGRWKLGNKKVRTENQGNEEASSPSRKRPLPRLTQYQYNQARMNGWNLETIKSKFRDVDESTIPVLEKSYQEQIHRVLDEMTSPDKPSSDYNGGKL